VRIQRASMREVERLLGQRPVKKKCNLARDLWIWLVRKRVKRGEDEGEQPDCTASRSFKGVGRG